MSRKRQRVDTPPQVPNPRMTVLNSQDEVDSPHLHGTKDGLGEGTTSMKAMTLTIRDPQEEKERLDNEVEKKKKMEELKKEIEQLEKKMEELKKEMKENEQKMEELRNAKTEALARKAVIDNKVIGLELQLGNIDHETPAGDKLSPPISQIKADIQMANNENAGNLYTIEACDATQRRLDIVWKRLNQEYDSLMQECNELRTQLKTLLPSLPSLSSDSTKKLTTDVKSGEYEYETDLANLEVLWPLLRSADGQLQIQELYAHLHTIVLPPNLYWPFGSDVDNVLFVRPSQQPILDFIIERFKKEGLSEGQKLFANPGFIVKGTPGIGKTTFLNLLLYYAAKLNTNVILHNAITKTMFLLCKDGTVDYHVIGSKRPSQIRQLLASRSTLYLFNPDEKDTQAIPSPAFTVIATSPDEKHYDDSRKQFGMMEKYLSPWTLEEALAANSALPHHQQLEEPTLRERFDNVGGSIRLLLSPEEMYISTDAKITGLLASLTVTELKRWHTLIQSEKSCGSLKAPHYLFHCQPNKEKNSLSCILRFAAKKTEELIMNHINIETYAESRSLVDFLMQIDPSRSSLGLRFEHYIHAYMRNYKGFSKLHVLKKKEEEEKLEVESVLESIPVYVRSAKSEKVVANALANSRCTYVVPSQSNYDAIDSFYVDGTTVYCFQVTINDEHKFDIDTYNTKTALIEKEYKKAVEAKANAMAAKNAEALTFKYCWVVDPGTQIPLKRYPSHYCIHVENIYLSSSSPPNDEDEESQQ